MPDVSSAPESVKLGTVRTHGASRVFYIHAGTHKTGTTYLQRFLTLNQSILQQAGLYIPRAGRHSPICGHHNLAWELNGDDRFTRSKGTWDDLLTELKSEGAPSACISSEDFEFLYRNPDGLHRLASLQELGYTVKVLFYLRPQIEYAESLYAELLKHGLAIGFDEFFEQFSGGQFTFRGNWHFASDYTKLLDSYASVFGKENIIVRRYRLGAPDEIVMDFVSQIFSAWNVAPEQFKHAPDPINHRISPSEMLSLLIRNTQGTAMRAGGVDHRETELPARFEPARVTDVARAITRIGYKSGKVLMNYGLFVPVVSGRRLAKVALASARLGRYAEWQRLSRRLFANAGDQKCGITLKAAHSDLAPAGAEGNKVRESSHHS